MAVYTPREVHDRLDALEREHYLCDCSGRRPCAVYEATWLALLAIHRKYVRPAVCDHAIDQVCVDCMDDDISVEVVSSVQTWCSQCGHDHAPNLGGICIGCPCEWRPS